MLGFWRRTLVSREPEGTTILGSYFDDPYVFLCDMIWNELKRRDVA